MVNDFKIVVVAWKTKESTMWYFCGRGIFEFHNL